MTVGRVAGGRLARRLESLRLLAGALALAAAAFACFWLLPPPAALAALAFTGLGISVLYPVTLSLAIAVSGGRTDAASARAAFASGLAIAVAPFALGALADAAGLRAAYAIVPALIGAGAIALALRTVGRAAAPSDLQGDGVVLRPFRDDDVAEIVRACSDPETVRFIPLIPVPYTENDARLYIEMTRAFRAGGSRVVFAIGDDEGGALVGAIDVRLGEIGSIGYWVAPWARNRGVATQALRLLAGWALREGGVRRLELVTHIDNVASQRVAEKAGFARRGTRAHHPPFRDGSRESVLFIRESVSQ
jgi:RimJ/RimL family protein N-acetyltransferase